MKPPEFPELFVEDGIERYYLRGELRERPHRFRTPAEGVLMARLAARLGAWSAGGGEVLCDMGFRLRNDPPTAVGIPISYIYPATADEPEPDEVWWVAEPPRLAVEVVRFDEPQGRLGERIDEYLACGVPCVWAADPLARSVTVYRPGADPELVRWRNPVTAGPQMSGFSCTVAEFFR